MWSTPHTFLDAPGSCRASNGIDLYLLFLTRNPRDIVASYSEDDIVFPRFKTFNTNIYLWLTYLLSLLVFLRQPRERRLLVRYEGFIADPQSVLGEILERAGSRAGSRTSQRSRRAWRSMETRSSDRMSWHWKSRRHDDDEAHPQPPSFNFPGPRCSPG